MSVRLTLSVLFGEEGFEVVTCSDGEEALFKARSDNPNAILLDQVMPKLSGHEVFDALRGDPATSSIPVFVLTGLGSSKDERWEGATFIGKPFDPEDLVARVRSAVTGD